MRTRFLYLLVFILFTSTLFAQTTIPVVLNWGEPLKGQDNKEYLHFDNAGYNEKGLPVHGNKLENKSISEAYLTDIITTPLPPEWNYMLEDKNSLPAHFEVKVTNKLANSGNYAVYEVFPFRLTNGIPEILISANVQLKTSDVVTEVAPRPRSSSNSVLATGNWVKVGTPQNGLYKITYSQLQSAGLIGGSVNSSLLKLYGNGGGFLSEQNSVFRYDDLKENAIEVVDGGDGNFDNSDYILFYGEGPHDWNFDWSDSSRFEHKYNVYADTNFYFVTVGTTPGLRLTNRNNLGGSPTYTTTTGDGYVFMEDDKYSLTHSGRQWMGDYFNFVNTYTYNFNLSDIDISQDIDVTMKVAARCVSCNTSITMKYNGATEMTLAPSPASSSYTAPYATDRTGNAQFPVNNGNVDLVLTKVIGDEAWIDYIEINYQKNLTANSSYSIFSDKNSLNQTNARFSFSNANGNHRVWDITNPLEPIQQEFTLSGSTGEFQANVSDTLHSFMVFDPAGALSPASIISIPNQNLHALTEEAADFVIITHPSFLSAAQDLANFHTTHDGMVVHITTTDKIYNEYSSGKQDVSAMRDYLKMYYDKHPVDYPKYVLLFGDGSYDYKPYLDRLDYDNTNFVPAYETMNSFDRGGASYCSDDFFALLDNNEGSDGFVYLSASSNIDMGIGRIPARTLDEAQGIVNKIKTYVTDIECMRDWRNLVTVIADDMEAGWEANFLSGSEAICNQIEGINPVWNFDKIYIDSYQQVSNAGQRYPEAEIAIYNRINTGSLIINYIGHGGETGMAAERVVQIDDFVQLTNEKSLPTFVTATCTFTRFDNPAFNSAGEALIQMPDKGAIALFSTIRPISIVNNWNTHFYNGAFRRLPNGEMPRLGDIMMYSKNQSPNDWWQMQNILLFGDPAIRLAYPEIKVVTDSINGIWADTIAGAITDTLMASQLVTISGHIEDYSGVLQSTYDGDLYTSIFDKASQLTTLGNDGLNQFNYELRKNVIFKGKSTIKDGRFTFQFVVPLDINYLIGEGKISYYATNNLNTDAHGYYTGFNVGGSENNCSSDASGPEIQIFMNDTNFQEMGITQPATHLLVTVSDNMGINTTGLGIGHDLQAIIDGDVQNPIILNNYYAANNNSYTSGSAEYYLTGLTPGFHTVEVQVWDGCNNPSSAILNFAVTNGEPALINFLAYPNPFSDEVTLAFEHNFEGKNVTATIDIMNTAGTTAKTWTQTYVPQGNREVSIKWDGRTDGGEKMGSGVYICRIMMQDDQGNKASGCCKLVLIH